MGEVLLAVLPGALLRTLIPVVAAILIGVLGRGRARWWGIWGFVVMAVATMVSGILFPMLPMLMQKTELSATVLSAVLNVVFTSINTVGTVLIVIAVIVGGRGAGVGPGPAPQRQPWQPPS